MSYTGSIQQSVSLNSTHLYSHTTLYIVVNISIEDIFSIFIMQSVYM